jgi:superfamily II DNA or RNA helicase
VNDPLTLADQRRENARLVALLELHGIAWRTPDDVPNTRTITPEKSRLSVVQKIAVFRRLFRGRPDVYPVRWESKTTGKSGYAPACANEWRAGVCEKPRIKCGDCGHRAFIPLSDSIFYAHLAGEHTIGIYPLLDDDSCYFLAIDLDDAEWRDDARALMKSCGELNVPAALEISRSGQGAHVWIFFSGRVPARDARRLGSALISHTCSSTRQLKLSSYDRMFPNQDVMPKGGFGNLIALPLQKRAREAGCSVFVDQNLDPYPDQWEFLSSTDVMSPEDIELIVQRTTGTHDPLDVAFIDEEDLAIPWQRRGLSLCNIIAEITEPLRITLANMIYFEKSQLPQILSNRLIRLAAFRNPEFYKAQALRQSVWDKPRVIACAENYPKHIALPRGCMAAVTELLREHKIAYVLEDVRERGVGIETTFNGTLREDQVEAVAKMLPHDIGILCAPTAFGKTVIASAIIASRKVNTLVLVHRTELLAQWQQRLRAFLANGVDLIGTIGGGKSKPTGKIDIAVMQSLYRNAEVNVLAERYGMIVVDECHHIGAASFEAILKHAKAKYVLGLTATPVRRDGQQAIIYMQCGPIRHRAASATNAPQDLAVVTHVRETPLNLPPGASIQEVFTHLTHDAPRTFAIAAQIKEAFAHGRKVLVLTERTDHLDAINAQLLALGLQPFVLHGRQSKKHRAALMHEIAQLPPDAPRILLATGRLIGEGFDHPPLDTLVLAMPVSWKGTLQQYVGRLHREHASKTDVRVFDFVDAGHPALVRMWKKRQQGYKAMGYRSASDGQAEM